MQGVSNILIKALFGRKGGWKMKDIWNEKERLEIEAEQEMIEQAERENWMEANNISAEY